MRRTEYLTELTQDLTFAVRQLLHHPGFTIVALVTLSLGIGATAAIFSAVRAVVLRPLPVPRPEQLVSISTSQPGVGASSVLSAGSYVAVAEPAQAFSSVTALQPVSFNLSAGETPVRTSGARVTASFFDVYGVAPELGRAFGAAEDQPGSEQVAVLSHRLWRRSFGGDPGVVGRDLRMNGMPYRVLGVMPERFDRLAQEAELWVPIAFTPERKAMHDEHYLTVLGRLRDGVSAAQAAEALKPVALDLRRIADYPGLVFEVTPVLQQLAGDYRTRFLVLLGAVGLVLLIACGNVASLLLAHGAVRARELAIRAALGAGRGRVVRQLLTEHAVLALAGGAAGVALAAWGIRALVALAPPGVPRLDQSRIDGGALAFAFGLALLNSRLLRRARPNAKARAPPSIRL